MHIHIILKFAIFVLCKFIWTEAGIFHIIALKYFFPQQSVAVIIVISLLVKIYMHVR